MNAIIHAFLEQVGGGADRVAVATHARRISYGDLALAAAPLAQRLADRPRSEPVVAATSDAVDLSVAALAAVAAGRPLAVVTARHGPDALDRHAAAVGATTIVVPEASDTDVTGREVLEVPSPPQGSGGSGGSRSRPDVTMMPVRELGIDDVVILGSTSGSTGDPKIVRRTASAVLGDASDEDDELARRRDDVLFRAFFAGGGTARSLLRSLTIGASMVCVDPRAVAASQILPLLRDERVTVARLVPSVLRRVLAASPREVRLPDLRLLASGGEQLRWDDVALARRHMVPGSRIVHTYGSTEVSSIACRVIPFEEPVASGVVPAGRARRGRRVWIADDSGGPVAPGETGRVVIEGRLDGTVAPFEQLDGGWQRYWSEDRGRLDENGELHLLGRSDGVVKVGAVRIDPGAVEEALRSAPEVKEAAVVAGAVAERVTIIAHVALHASAAGDGEQRAVARIREHLAAHLESAAMPTRITVHAEGLPLLPSGKIDRRGLDRPIER